MTGIFITREEFESLPNNKQMLVLFENQIKTLTLINNNNLIAEKYKFHQKLIYAWLGILTIAAGFVKYLGVI